MALDHAAVFVWQQLMKAESESARRFNRLNNLEVSALKSVAFGSTGQIIGQSKESAL